MKLRRLDEWTEEEIKEVKKVFAKHITVGLGIIINKILEIEERWQNDHFDWRK